MTRSILHVAQPRDAGVPRVAAALVSDQVGRGFEVSVASPPDGDLRLAAEHAGARWLPWSATREPGPGTLGEARRLATIVREVNPDLVHLHSSKAGLAGRLVLRGRRPVVFQPNSWSFEAAGGALGRAAIAWERLGARWADVVVCVSADERRRAEQAGVLARFAGIPNGVNLTHYAAATQEDRSAARAALGIATDTPLAVTVGRLARQKGQDVLLSAWPRVLDRVDDAELVLVGEGPDRAALEALGVPRVRFAGGVRDVRAWLAAASVIVQPSRWEGMSISLLEAMAAARGVVAADVSGMREALAEGCGAVVATEAIEPLADAVAERLAAPGLADREGAAGRRRVERQYDVRVITERMAELYEQTIERRASHLESII
ncbi:MAG: glycosyltransferase [Solirubrobacteraceae bacterium]